ncbi:MAG: phosphate ABC transporter ATP-binding protein [SAR202 cluster bacterium]|nr:phosphate ABC transporter ATP-binding protein [SAR202 cluster bacterium]
MQGPSCCATNSSAVQRHKQLQLSEHILQTRGLSVYYGTKQAINDVTLNVARNRITAIIGPSGCGKSTLLRCFNRMNDLVPRSRITGQVLFEGQDLYAPDVDPTEIRYQIGMVFQRPNPFPKSIFENVAFGPKINGFRGNLNELVEKSLVRAALWEEVKDRVNASALALSGGQQQRLCIARALAVEPRVILMDEPCSSLDPIATLAIEDLMRELSQEYSIVIVTHNMQQAARVSDYTTFLMNVENRGGQLVEFGDTRQIFTNPKDERTEAYITGRFG